MKLLAVIGVLVGGCGGHGTHTGDAAGTACTPFSVTASGSATEVQPVWAGDSWAIARPGTYLRIDDAGALTSAALADLPDESFAYDGVELGYYVPTPLPHIALFTPGDVSTLHASPSFGTSSGVGMTGSVRADRSNGSPRIATFYSDFSDHAIPVLGWSDGTSTHIGHEQSKALAIAAAGSVVAPASVDAYADLSVGGLGNPGAYQIVIEGPGGCRLPLSEGGSGPSFQLAASGTVSILRIVTSSAWECAGGSASPIVTPPIAWNGDAFVSFAQGALQLFDASYQPTATRPLQVTGTTLLGVGATADRVLLVLASATPSSVDYVQVCL